MMLVEPCSNGLGSDMFCILWDGEELHGLNASGRAPAAWTPDYFRRKYGADAVQPPKRGWDSVTRARAPWPAGWRCPSASASCPSPTCWRRRSRPRERGYAVPIVVQEKWAAAAPLLAGEPGWAEAFLPKGRPPEVGERFAFPAAARALRAIAATAARRSTAARSPRRAAEHSAPTAGR